MRIPVYRKRYGLAQYIRSRPLRLEGEIVFYFNTWNQLMVDFNQIKQ